MSKVSKTRAMVFCGVDVSAATLAVAVEQEGQPVEQREFANSTAGHKALIAWLCKRKAGVRVSLEATGIYSLDLALALDAAEGVEVAVLNPKAVNRFAQTLRRSKTDSADAQVLAAYSRRMPFVAWRAPDCEGLRLRTLSRHIDGLTVQHTRERNRLHAARIGFHAALRSRGPEALTGCARAADRAVAARGHSTGPGRRRHAAAVRTADQHAGDRPDQRVATAGRTCPAITGDVGAAVGGP